MNRFIAAALLVASSLSHAQTTLVPGSYTCTNCTITVLPVTPPASAPSAPAPTIKVVGTPTGSTTATSASIAWSATPNSTPVWCRRDTYAPGPCTANPFNLGVSPNAPLAAGPHTVDFYLTASPDTTKPADFHGSWTITAPAAASAPSAGASAASAPASTTTTPPVTTSALPLIGWPAGLVNSNASGNWDGKSTIVANDSAKIVTTALVADPLGSSTIQVSRIHQDFATIWGGQRAELAWENIELKIGVDYWIAFGAYRVPGEWNAQDTNHLFFQAHTRQGGNTTPDMYVEYSPLWGSMDIGTAYNANDPATWSYNGGSNGDTTSAPILYKGAIPASGTWTRFVFHKRPGYLASQNPIFECWMSLNGAAYVQLFSYTGPNTYNITSTINPSLSIAQQSYPRQGIYFYSPFVIHNSTLAYYQTPLYFQQGANLLAQAQASLAALGKQ